MLDRTMVSRRQSCRYGFLIQDIGEPSQEGAMSSGARLFGHPIHQMLIVFPLGLLAMAVIFDVIRLAGGSPALGPAAFYMIGARVICGLVAAVFGLIDWLAIPSKTRAKSVGAWHAI